MSEQLPARSGVGKHDFGDNEVNDCPKEQNPQCARRPQQERGQRRVDAILDCAAALIAEEGIAGVKLHRIAQRTCTATGSMYHFFPDREAVLRALLVRHTHALRTRMEQLEGEVLDEWSQLSTAELVDRLVDPFLDYIDRHPDFIPLTRLVRITSHPIDRNAELDQCVVRLHAVIVALCRPDASAEERQLMGLSMTGIAEGFIALIARTDDAGHARRLRVELRRALVAYLDSYVTGT